MKIRKITDGGESYVPFHFPRGWNLSRDNGGWQRISEGSKEENADGEIRSNGSRGYDGDDIVLASSARTKAKGGDLFIGVTHVGDDAANSRTDFARRDLRFRRVFAKPRMGDEL